MDNAGRQLRRQYVDFVASLYREGFLDDQFVQLQKLQDEGNPYFVVEVVSLYFEDSEKLMNNLTSALQQHVVDFKQIDAHVHQFKGSSSSIGAQRVKNMCVVFRHYCEEKNLDGPVDRIKVPASITSYTTSVKNHKLEAQPLWLYTSQHLAFRLSVILLGCLTVGKLMLHYAPRLDEMHVPKCLKCLQQVKHEYYIVKNKLETMIRLERQILEAGGTIP